MTSYTGQFFSQLELGLLHYRAHSRPHPHMLGRTLTNRFDSHAVVAELWHHSSRKATKNKRVLSPTRWQPDRAAKIIRISLAYVETL